MGRQNIAFLYARVKSNPKISVDKDTGEYKYGIVPLDVVRGKRAVHDDIHFIKHDYPLLLSREKDCLDEILSWKENSIVEIKGVLTTNKITKSSYCSHCKDDNGNATENKTEGNFVYITPIYVRKIKDCETKQEAVEDIVENREISNQIFVLGTVLKDPKIFTTKQKKQITQYPIALNRKFTIRSDDPTIRTDYPVVKSYGEQARSDKTYIKYQSEVIIDGFLQARRVTRKCKCKNCGQVYAWEDNCMELVPYDVEYVSGYKTKDEAEAEYGESVEDHMQKLYESGFSDELDDDLKSDDVVET